MNKVEEFVAREKETLGGIYSDVTYALNELEPFIDAKTLKLRKYYTRLPSLGKYMELLDAAKAGAAKEGLWGMFSGDKYISPLQDYKQEHSEAFRQLEKCRECQCLKCPRECSFDSCLGCREGAWVVECDRTALNTVFYNNYIVALNNDSNGETEDYTVLATMQNATRDKRYILMEGVHNREKYVLHYIPGISENTYGEITDPEEFDEVVAAYQRIER